MNKTDMSRTEKSRPLEPFWDGPAFQCKFIIQMSILTIEKESLRKKLKYDFVCDFFKTYWN